MGSAILSSIAVNALNGFSKTSKPASKPQEFLPYQMAATSKNPFWDKVSAETCKYLRNQIENGELPPQFIKLLATNPDFYTVIQEK